MRGQQFVKLGQEMLALATPRGRLLAVAALLSALGAVGPERLERRPSLCLISKVIGRPCPACGSTRAAACLVRGDIRRAGRYNRNVYLVALVLGWLCYQDARQLLQQRRGGVIPPKGLPLSPR